MQRVTSSRILPPYWQNSITNREKKNKRMPVGQPESWCDGMASLKFDTSNGTNMAYWYAYDADNGSNALEVLEETSDLLLKEKRNASKTTKTR